MANDNLSGKRTQKKPHKTPLTEEQRDYLKQLKNYKASGVRITIDDRQLPEKDWKQIFMLAERTPDGANQFYMSDIVTNESGEISEIRLDKITVR
ncbi:MAG: hypothetical protein Q4E57_06275 [Eubacteriales bacterium]|nr:hypothetical protein [Eubacteriales bacterium]